MAVLLPRGATAEMHAVADRLCEEFGCPLEQRRGRTVSGVLRDGWDSLISVGHDHVSYYYAPSAPPFFYHPGLAKNRIGSLRREEPETLVRASGLGPGMSFLDCTLGKATDSTVAAFAVGPAGRVVGCEAHPVVAALVRIGLRSMAVEGQDLADAMARVEVRSGRHLDLLRELPDDAFDVVYFDPFFEDAVAGSNDMDSLRELGDHSPVSEEALAEARRVARLRVVHKVRTDRPEPAALAGWTLVRGKRRIGYRVWEAHSSSEPPDD